uniref:Uncharacterized protein n=1 Tax=Anguilla anguilla TaxID=7936 RepID=A0A0E9VN39_ANGAN
MQKKRNITQNPVLLPGILQTKFYKNLWNL